MNSFSNGWDVRYETVKEALNKNSTTGRAFFHFDTDQKKFFAGNSTGDKTFRWKEETSFVSWIICFLKEINLVLFKEKSYRLWSWGLGQTKKKKQRNDSAFTKPILYLLGLARSSRSTKWRTKRSTRGWLEVFPVRSISPIKYKKQNYRRGELEKKRRMSRRADGNITLTQVNCLERGKTRAGRLRLVFVGRRIGLESGASLPDQSQSEIQLTPSPNQSCSSFDSDWLRGSGGATLQTSHKAK